MSLGKRMKELRLANGLTQPELAARLNLSKANISKYEAGIIEPNVDTLKQLSVIYDVSIDYLIGQSDSIQLKQVPDQIDTHTIEYALHGEIRDLSEAEKQEILDFVKFKKMNKK